MSAQALQDTQIEWLIHPLPVTISDEDWDSITIETGGGQVLCPVCFNCHLPYIVLSVLEAENW